MAHPMTNGDDDEQPVVSSSPSQSEVTRFLGLLISAVMAEARVWLAAANGLPGIWRSPPGFCRPPPGGGGGGDVGAFARRQRRYEDLVLASFFGLQGVEMSSGLRSNTKNVGDISHIKPI